MYLSFSKKIVPRLNSLSSSKNTLKNPSSCSFLNTHSTSKSSSSSVSLHAEETTTQRNYLPLSKLPGPCKNIPYFGTFFVHLKHERTAAMLDKHLEWAEKYGPIFKETILGKTMIYVNDVESVEKVCRAEGKIPDRLHATPLFAAVKNLKDHAGLMNGLVDSEGEEWLKIRRIYSKRLLRPVEMKNYFKLFSYTAVEAVEMIKKNRNEDNVLKDQKKYLIKWSMDSFSKFIFGKPFGFMEDPPTADSIKLDNSMSTLMEDIVTYEFLPKAFKPFYKKMHASMKDRALIFDQLTGKHLRRTMERREKEGFRENDTFSFGDYILAQENLSFKECTTFASDIFGGGYDTTTTAIDAILYSLGTHPDIQEKVYNEICNVMPENGILDYNASQGLPYMRAVLKEAMRLYPIGTFLPRCLKEDIVLNGYLIPKQTGLLLHSYALSRSEDHFEKPLEFIPERWLRGADNPPNPYLSLPFGTGARSCIGRRAAEGNIFAFLSQFLKTFKIEEVLGDFKPVMNVFLRNSSPMHLKLSDR